MLPFTRTETGKSGMKTLQVASQYIASLGLDTWLGVVWRGRPFAKVRVWSA